MKNDKKAKVDDFYTQEEVIKKAEKIIKVLAKEKIPAYELTRVFGFILTNATFNVCAAMKSANFGKDMARNIREIARLIESQIDKVVEDAMQRPPTTGIAEA